MRRKVIAALGLLAVVQLASVGCAGDLFRNSSSGDGGAAGDSFQADGGNVGAGGSGGGSGGQADGAIFALSLSPSESQILTINAEVQFTANSSYSGYATGTVFHFEFCAGALEGEDFVVVDETQDFGIAADMAAYADVKSAYSAEYGEICDLSVLATVADGESGTTTYVTVTPPALSQDYTTMRIRVVAYDADADAVSIIEGSDSKYVFLYDVTASE